MTSLDHRGIGVKITRKKTKAKATSREEFLQKEKDSRDTETG